MVQSFEDIDEAVAEYLEHRRFSNTLECFCSETRHRQLRRDRLADSGEEWRDSGQTRARGEGDVRDESELHTSTAVFEAFDSGDLYDFLSAWSAFIPKPLLRREATSPLAHEVRLTEFLSCVHCATLPFRASSLKTAAGPREASVACAKAMSSFRRYLDRRGVALAQDSDVVNFFALPRIPDPSAHPTFEEIFQDAWLVTLRERVEILLAEVDVWRPSEPLLVRLLRRENQSTIEDATDRHQPKKIITNGVSDEPGAKDKNDAKTHCGVPPTRPRRRSSRNKSARQSIKSGIREGEEGNRRKSKNGTTEGSSTAPLTASRRVTDLEVKTVQQSQQHHLARSNSDRAILGQVDYSAVKRDLRNLAKDILAGPPPEFVAEPDGDTGDSCNTLDGGVDKRPSAAIEAALILQTIRWRFSDAPAGKIRRAVLYHLIRHDIFDLKLAAYSGGGVARGASSGINGSHSKGNHDSLLEILLGLAAPPSNIPITTVETKAVGLGRTRGINEMDKSIKIKKNAEIDNGDDGKVEAEAENNKKSGGKESFFEDHAADRPTNDRENDATKDDGKRANSLAEKGWEDFDGEPGRLVAEYAVRLLDALATMSKARSYILGERCAEIIELLTKTLRREIFRETGLAKGLLRVIIRLSRCPSALEAIVSSGFVVWTAEMLGSHFSQGEGSQDASTVFLRHATDILGNVSGIVVGRAAVMAVTPDVLGSLANLLEHEDAQVQSNAFRALRLLLEAGGAKERALETGMDALLQDLKSRRGQEAFFVEEVESLLDLLVGATDVGREQRSIDIDHIQQKQQLHDDIMEGGTEDTDSLSDDNPEAYVVSYFVEATKAPCGEELLRQRYHLSTAEAKHEAIWSDGARGGDEEELICGCSINKAKRRGPGGWKGEDNTTRMATPEAGSVTVIGGEEKVYDRPRPGLLGEMQSRPRIPRTPTAQVPAAK